MDLVLAIAIASIVGIAGLVRRPHDRRAARLRKASVEPIRALVEGNAVVARGTVALLEPGSDLRSPLSQRPCVYWLVTFDELGTGGDYVELGRTEQGRPFVLTSDAGSARVVPEQVRVAMQGSVSRYRIAVLDQPTYNDAAIRLARSVCKRPNYPHQSSLRVTEYAVMPGMVVTVKGHCTREPDPDAAGDVTGYRAALPTRPVLSGTREAPLLLCDHSRTPAVGQ